MFDKIQTIIADALYCNPNDVTRSASLVDDLGAESIDFLDITFRMEKEFKIRIPRGELENRARGDLSDEEFAVNGRLTEAGLMQLKQMMPEVPEDRIVSGLTSRDIPSLFTAATFERMVLEQLQPPQVARPQGASAHGELTQSV